MFGPRSRSKAINDANKPTAAVAKKQQTQNKEKSPSPGPITDNSQKGPIPVEDSRLVKDSTFDSETQLKPKKKKQTARPVFNSPVESGKSSLDRTPEKPNNNGTVTGPRDNVPQTASTAGSPDFENSEKPKKKKKRVSRPLPDSSAESHKSSSTDKTRGKPNDGSILARNMESTRRGKKNPGEPHSSSSDSSHSDSDTRKKPKTNRKVTRPLSDSSADNHKSSLADKNHGKSDDEPISIRVTPAKSPETPESKASSSREASTVSQGVSPKSIQNSTLLTPDPVQPLQTKGQMLICLEFQRFMRDFRETAEFNLPQLKQLLIKIHNHAVASFGK